MRRNLVGLVLVVALSLIGAALAQAEVQQNLKVDDAGSTVNPCNGEQVDYTGVAHVLVTFTVNGNNISGKTMVQDAGYSGVGQTTGAKYRRNGTSQQKFQGSLQNGKFTTTFNNSFQWIAQGDVPNFVVHDVVHLTINANGEVTADFVKGSVECK